MHKTPHNINIYAHIFFFLVYPRVVKNIYIVDKWLWNRFGIEDNMWFICVIDRLYFYLLPFVVVARFG